MKDHGNGYINGKGQRTGNGQRNGNRYGNGKRYFHCRDSSASYFVKKFYENIIL